MLFDFLLEDLKMYGYLACYEFILIIHLIIVIICVTAFLFLLQCREKLTVRQQLQRLDYKVNRGLTVACRANIMSERCVDNLQRTPTGDMREARLSVILLCLENATRFGNLKYFIT